MEEMIIGRCHEKNELKELYQSGKSEFIIVQGRRRVGKTFLVRETFADKFTFYHTGLSPYEMGHTNDNLKKMQLANFYSTLLRYGYAGSMPGDWLAAFDALIALLEAKPREERLVVFIDELPWMDTPRSGFITAFEHFWNGWGAGKHNLMLIVCGSSTSWITDKIINSKGGLYNRATYEIQVNPFNLKECEEFFRSRDIMFDRYDQLQAYMFTGGIPYYLSMFRKGWSLARNIDNLCFGEGAKLKDEFNRLFHSLFTNADDCIKIVRLLGKKREGYTRQEIAQMTKLPYGGGLTLTLKSLVESRFISIYTFLGDSVRNRRYRLSDCFCLFYLSFMDKNKSSNPRFWQDNLLSPKLNAWRGFAFENVCFNHIKQIKTTLGVQGVHTEESPWRTTNSDSGAQIDMVINRADRVINLCEIKFSSNEFTIDKAYDKVLRNKIEMFLNEMKERKTILLTFITTYGIAKNEYSGRVQNIIEMDDLFRP